MSRTTGTSRAVALLLVVAAVSGVVTAVPSPSHSAASTTQDELSAEVVTYDGEVAIQDGVVTVRGRAPGYSRVAIVFVDRAAGTIAVGAPVGANGTFRQDVPIADADGRLGGGDVQGFVVAPGGDRVFGRTGLGPDTLDQFVSYVRNLQRRGLTEAAVVERIRAESVDASGSDDLLVEIPFRLTGARTEIVAVGPAGSDAPGVSPVAPGQAMTVRGVTNRRPDVANVSVRVTEGPSSGAFPEALILEWGEDGVWTADLQVPGDADLGAYVVESNDGVDTDPVGFAVAERAPTPTATGTATATPPPVTPTAPPATRPARPTRTAPPSPLPTTTGRAPGGLLPPGVEIFVGVFLVSVFVVGLVLLAMGRRRRYPPRL